MTESRQQDTVDADLVAVSTDEPAPADVQPDPTTPSDAPVDEPAETPSDASVDEPAEHSASGDARPATEPTEPTEPTELGEPAQAAQSADTDTDTDATPAPEAVGTDESADPSSSAEPIPSAEPAAAEPGAPVGSATVPPVTESHDTVEPAETTGAATSADAAETPEMVETAESAESAESAETADEAETAPVDAGAAPVVQAETPDVDATPPSATSDVGAPAEVNAATTETAAPGADGPALAGPAAEASAPEVPVLDAPTTPTDGALASRPTADAEWKPRPWEPGEDFTALGAIGAGALHPTPVAAAAPVRVSARTPQETPPVTSGTEPPAPPEPLTPFAASLAPAPDPALVTPVLLAPAAEQPTERLPRTPAGDRPEADGPGGPRAGSPMDVFPGEPTRRHWPRVLGVVATLVVVLAGVYVGALWLWADRVPPGATVAGVEIGGLQETQAVSIVEDSLAAATTEPIPVAAGDNRTTLDPVGAGLSLDASATVASVTGFGLEPARLWHHLFGLGPVEPVTDIDRTALATAVEDVAGALAVEPVDGTIVFVDGQAQTTDAVDGAAIDLGAATDVVVAGWLTAPRPLELPTDVAPPAITQDEVDRALDEVARPLVRAPIVVAVADQLAELPTDVVADAASFVRDGEELVLHLDGERLVEAVTARTTDLLTLPSDATFAFESGSPVVVPGTPGTTLDPDALAAAVADAGLASDRTAHVDLVESAPTESTEELQALGITQIVSEFSTPLTREPRRTGNIVNGASKINGTLVRPGDTFSLTEALGPIDAAHGFVEAGAIINGEHTDAWGGGLSQISTTTYNAAYLAGFEDVEHHPHSEWFSRYPEGREATIFTGQLDMQWRNDTPYGALVQAWAEGGRVYVRIWGTPYWTVESSTSGRSAVVAPTTVYSESPTCEAQGAGNPGFTVTVTRRILLDGAEQDKQSWTVRYKPQNAIVCGPAPAVP